MSINFTDGTSLGFGDLDTAKGFDQRTYMAWIEITANQSIAESTHLINCALAGAALNIFFGVLRDATYNALQFVFPRATTSGQWRTSATSFDLNTKYCVAVTYDKTATANDPVLYVGGAAVGITEITIPAGDAPDESAHTVWLGGANAATDLSKIILHDHCTHNVILTAQEIKEYNDMRMAGYIKRGLVFHPILIGAAGKSDFTGALATNTNYIIDEVSGAQGNPVGNPTAVPDTLLTWGQ